jgi:hypothetical protein
MFGTVLVGFGVAFAGLPAADAKWESLATKPVPVECTEQGEVTWCRAKARVLAPIDQVVASLRNMADNADKYESILAIDKVADDVMHITLDFPSPLADRDYVAKYVYADQGSGVHTLRWSSVEHADAPPVEGVVRLDAYQGEWRLEAADSSTWVTYMWHAHYGGSLPTFALPQARKKTAGEALKDIASVNDTTYERK